MIAGTAHRMITGIPPSVSPTKMRVLGNKWQRSRFLPSRIQRLGKIDEDTHSRDRGRRLAVNQRDAPPVTERIAVGATVPSDVELVAVPSDWGPSLTRYRIRVFQQSRFTGRSRQSCCSA